MLVKGATDSVLLKYENTISGYDKHWLVIFPIQTSESQTNFAHATTALGCRGIYPFRCEWITILDAL